jgi:hypothetical protein
MGFAAALVERGALARGLDLEHAAAILVLVATCQRDDLPPPHRRVRLDTRPVRLADREAPRGTAAGDGRARAVEHDRRRRTPTRRDASAGGPQTARNGASSRYDPPAAGLSPIRSRSVVSAAWKLSSVAVRLIQGVIRLSTLMTYKRVPASTNSVAWDIPPASCSASVNAESAALLADSAESQSR